MFETIEEIIGIAVGGIALLSAITGFLISLVKCFKSKRLAETANKMNEINVLVTEKVVEIEKLFSEAAHVLKSMGISVGGIKKENVMNYIEFQCTEKGITFDKEYWSNEIERLIKVMNANKNS